MKEQEIARIIRDVLAAEEKVVKQLRAEKRATGDYSKVVIVPYGDMEMRFEVRKTLGQYPPVSFRLRHLVSVMKDGKAIVRSNVSQLKCRYCMGVNSPASPSIITGKRTWCQHLMSLAVKIE